MNKNNKSYREAFFSERQFSSDKWDHYFEIVVQNGGSLEIAKKLEPLRISK